MSNSLTLDLWNSVLPLVLLCGLVVLLPGWLAGRGNLSQARLSRAVGVTAVVTLLVGAVLAAGLYAAINEGVWAGVLAAPLERAGFFLGRSALFALLWGPVLGFVWLVKAQELNRRLGMRMVDGEGGKGKVGRYTDGEFRHANKSPDLALLAKTRDFGRMEKATRRHLEEKRR